jgi:site-specific recombinase XerC
MFETPVVAAREAASECGEASTVALLAEAALPKAAMPLRSIFDSCAKEAELAPSTVKRWSPVVDRLIAHLGHDDAVSIARADIVACKDALLDSGISNVTACGVYVAAVKAMLQFAVDQGRLTQNPAKEACARRRRNPTTCAPSSASEPTAPGCF